MSPTKRSRQQVIIEDVPDDDPGTTLPPIPEAIREEFSGDQVVQIDPNTGDVVAPQNLPDAQGYSWGDFSPEPMQPTQRSYSDHVNDTARSQNPSPATSPLADAQGDGQTDAGAIAGTGVPNIRYTEPLRAPQTDDGEPPHALDGEITPPPKPGEISTRPRYEQRIRIVEAWQFTEGIAKAPEWIDKNWASWGDEDVLRQIPAGPAIRVPGPGGTMICRHGDYIARQLIILAPGLPAEERIEVWPRESFEKFFIKGS
jgi:hypothetical protein